MKIAYFWLTSQGRQITEKICSALGGQIESKENFRQTIRQDFHKYDAFVFVMATGIVIRTIADLLESKANDPAVIVIDQKGKFVISLLSGHLGGANALAVQIAEILDAVPVITTATDTENLIAFDLFAKANDLYIENLSALKSVSSAMLEGQKISVYSDFRIQHYDPIFLTDTLPAQVVISDKILSASDALLLRPKSLIIGIGCKKQTPPEHLENCFLKLMQELHLSVHSVISVATIGLKQKESAILQLCDKYGFSLQIIPDDAIRNCNKIFENSEFVQQVTGLPSVAEACSYLASECGEALTGKVKFPGVTLAVCRKKLPELIFRKDLL